MDKYTQNRIKALIPRFRHSAKFYPFLSTFDAYQKLKSWDKSLRDQDYYKCVEPIKELLVNFMHWKRHHTKDEFGRVLYMNPNSPTNRKKSMRGIMQPDSKYAAWINLWLEND